MKTIALTQGYMAVVDDSDYERVSKFKWFADVDRNSSGKIKNVYAAHKVKLGNKQSNERLHRFIMGVSDRGIQVDHADRNGLNCQQENLRLATPVQNKRNSISSPNKTGYKGVRYLPKASVYQARITVNGKRKSLGCSKEAKTSAKMYDRAAVLYFGEFARLNFP